MIITTMEKVPEFNLLCNIPNDKFTELSKSLIKEMCGFIPELWSEITTSLNWTIDQSSNVKESLLKTIIEAIYFPDDNRIEYLKTYLDTEKSEILARMILSKKLLLANALMKQHNATVKPTLNNFDWKVKWILGNSASTVMKYPLVQLNLGILSAYDEPNSNIFLEFNKNELDQLINILEEQINV